MKAMIVLAIRLALVGTVLSLMLGACDRESATPPAARVAFLADVSRSFDGQEVEQICLAAFNKVLAHAAETRGTVSVELINAAPLSGSRTPVDVVFTVAEEFEGNPVYSAPLLQRQRDTALGQLEALYQVGPTTRGTDVLASIELAERILSRSPLGPTPEQKFLVMCGDMLNTESPVDFYHQDLNDTEIDQIIERLRESGQLPTGLAGAKVYLVAAGQPASGQVDAERLRAVETFFRRYFQAASAQIVTYGATLPTFP